MFKYYINSFFFTPSGPLHCLARNFHSSRPLYSHAKKASHYEVLGLSKNASLDDIKKAYKQKAREHHPDLNQNSPDSSQKFIEISTAYEVLKDSSRRQQYDYEFEQTYSSSSSSGYNSSYNTSYNYYRERGPSPGASYSSNPRRRNSMFGEEDMHEFDEEEEIYGQQEIHIDLSNLFGKRGPKTSGAQFRRAFRDGFTFADFEIFNLFHDMHARNRPKHKSPRHSQSSPFHQSNFTNSQSSKPPPNKKESRKQRNNAKFNGEEEERERDRGSKKQEKNARMWYNNMRNKNDKNDNNNNNNNNNNTESTQANSNKTSNNNNTNNASNKGNFKSAEEPTRHRKSRQERKWERAKHTSDFKKNKKGKR